MNSTGRWLAVVLLALIAGAAGFWMGRRHQGTEAEAPEQGEAEGEVKAVVDVEVVPIRRDSIAESLTAYGTVVAPPGDVQILSVGFESVIKRVLVAAGQQVSQGTELVEVAASPDAAVTLQETNNTLAAAERDLKLVRRRFETHLATNADVSAAEAAVQSARLKLSSLTERGVGAAQTLKASAAGVVSKIDVQAGQVVPAGAALVEIATGNRIQVALGVEPSDVGYLKLHQPVRLAPMEHPTTQPLVGEIQVIGQRVDPMTRLVNVQVSLPPDAHWMLDSFIVGAMTKTAGEGLVVPRQALLPEEDGTSSLFTIKADHAVKHAVRVAVDDGHDAQVIGEDLKEGEPVVVLGNYELEDGMSVKPHRASTSAPATNESKLGATQP